MTPHVFNLSPSNYTPLIVWYARNIAVCDQILSWYFIQKSSYGLPGTAGEHTIITRLYHIRLTSIISFKTVLYCIKGYKTSLLICLQNLFYIFTGRR